MLGGRIRDDVRCTSMCSPIGIALASRVTECCRIL